jgi:hypothetical protein
MQGDFKAITGVSLLVTLVLFEEASKAVKRK